MAIRGISICLALYGASASAETFNVTTTADTRDGRCDSHCSLREAIDAARQTSGPDTILLQGRIYTLSRPNAEDPSNEDPRIDDDENRTGDLDLGGELLIKGKSWVGVPATVIDAQRLDRGIEVLAGAKVELRDIEIRNGRVSQRGGGLANAGQLRLTRMRIAQNQASSGFDLGQGGGIFNGGRLVINYSLIEDNEAGGGEASAGEGAGIYNVGSLYVNETRIAGNLGHDDNDLGSGAGLLNRGYAQLQRSLLRGNATGANGTGGAVLNRAGATLEMYNTTLSDNYAGEVHAGGAALANGNPFDDAGGRMTLHYVTIVDNVGGVFNRGSATLVATLVGGNYERRADPERHYASGNNCRNHGDTFGMLTTSVLLGNDGNCAGDIVVDNATVVGAVVGPLEEHGGRTRVHLPVINSVAIDTSQSTCPAFDQRSLPRPADGNGDGNAVCDIGAVERQPGE